MAFERLRAHGAAVGTSAVLVLAGVSVMSLAVAETRLEQYDRDGRADAATVLPSTPPPSTTTTAPAAPVVSGPPSGLLAELFALLNADRAGRGLGPLSWDGRLSAAAQQTSDAMAESGAVAPPDVDALLALGFTRAAQLVLTAPYDVTATSADYGWMGSAPHRATILDAALRSVGIGATSSPDGRIWIAADFGASA
jgi:uncharacterized protein YkwD